LNGYLFTPGDVRDLTRRMGELADQPQHWGEMGSVSREIALQHDLDMVIHKYESVYTQLISVAHVTGINQEQKEIA
jgi:glycosyltransferase involved in cell wall biosynthesis